MDSSLPGLSVHWDFPRQEYWSGLPFPSSEDLPDPGIESGSPALQADSLSTELQGRSDQRTNLLGKISHFIPRP